MSEFDGIGDHAARAAIDALTYLGMRLAQVPVRGRKTPWDASQNSARVDWVALRLTTGDIEREFTGPVTGVGIILGEPSRNLVDVDLDCPEARAAADPVLPATACVFGRPSTPRAHRIYRADRAPGTVRFKDIDPSKTTMLELRSTGAQTVFPRAFHVESGEYVRFDAGEAAIPASILAQDLDRVVHLLAATTLLARHWPRTPGSRHDLALALAGFLLRGGLSEAETCLMVDTAARVAGDEQRADRVAAVVSTATRLKTGQPATGGPGVRAVLGDAVVAALAEVRSSACRRTRHGLRPCLSTRLPYHRSR